MKFTPDKLTPEAIATLAFTRVGAIAFGYFKAQMSPPSSQLGTRSKKSSNLIQLDVKKESVNLRRPHLYYEINP